MATVSLVAAFEDIKSGIDRAFSLIGLSECIRSGNRVLLKPNLHGGEGYTSPQVLEALTQWVFDQGASEVTIGDGPFWGMTDGEPYFQRTGLRDVARRTGAKLAFFHSGPYRLIHPGDPALPATLGVSEHLYEADVVISVPIPKTHFNTLISIALKNLKGCLRPVDKKRLHELDLHRAIGLMDSLLAPLVTAHLLDGTIGYEGMGPGNADPFPWGLLAASTDPVALDATACRLMGIDPAQVRLVQEAATRHVGVWRSEEIQVMGESVQDHARRFVLPHEALARAFPGLRINSQRACSVCMESLFTALDVARKKGYPVRPLTALIGPGDALEAELLVGRCACAGSTGSNTVGGCPPDPKGIFDKIVNLSL